MKKNGNNWHIIDSVIIGVILIIALGLRLYDVQKPLIDFHSWRQADTAAVARNFVRNGFDLLHPKYDDISSVQSGIENPQGYRFVEFPIYNALFGGLYKVAPVFPIHVWGRLVDIFFALITAGVIYYFLLKEANRKAAVFGTLVFAAYPFFVYYTRVVLPDTMAVSCAFIALFFLYLFTFRPMTPLKQGLFLIMSSILFSAALLIKPTTVFFIPAFAYLFFKKYHLSAFKKLAPYILVIIAFTPLILWRMYIKQFPEGIPFSEWLITSVNTSQGRQIIFFRPAFFRWIFYERINNLILGGFTSAFLVLGILLKPKRLFIPMLGLSSLIYLFVFQGGNVQHEYYQIMILPVLAMYVGIGTDFITSQKRLFVHPVIVYSVVIIIYAFSFFISYYQVRNYYSYISDLPQIAQIVQTLTPPTSKIVTDTTGDTTLLYLIDRKGSAAVYKDLHEFKKAGYSYFVSFNKDTIDQVKLVPDFKIVFANDKFTLFAL